MKPKEKLDFNEINTDIEKRWESGESHHPESEELMAHIADIDYKFNEDRFGWKMGGDGDNGEELMYILDIYFDAKDKKFWKENGSK